MNEGDVVGFGAIRLAGARDVIEMVDQEGTRLQAGEDFGLAGLGGKGADAFEMLALGVDEGILKLAGDTQQLVAVLVADAECDGYGNDAAEHGRPEGDRKSTRLNSSH